MILDQQIKNQGEPQKKIQIIAFRTPFNINSPEQAHTIINDGIIKKISEQHDQIRIEHIKEFPITLEKKNNNKPLYLLKIKKKRNKRTGQIIKEVTHVKNITKLYEYEEMTDFVHYDGSSTTINENSQNQKKDLTKMLKDQLAQSILQKYQKKQNNGIYKENSGLRKFIKPENYLKKYNLTPSNCDFFMSKTKIKNDKFLSGISINFEDPIPEGPPQQLPLYLKYSKQLLFLYETINEYLQKRPCWLKNSLLVKLKQDGFSNFSVNDLKTVLKYLCYTYRNGPWKNTFCRFSYNPKSAYSSLLYQIISLKLKQREPQDYQQNIAEELYDPTFQEISLRCVRSYQLCDLHMEQIKQILRGKMISEEGECCKQFGWFSGSEYNHAVKIMKKHVDHV